MRLSLKRSIKFFSLLLVVSHMPKAYSMSNALQKACSGLSIVTQWWPSAYGAYAVASVAKAKYIDNPEVSEAPL